MKKNDIRYDRDALALDLASIWKKNKPVRVMYYDNKGKRKELHLWGLSIKRNRKYIELCLSDFPKMN